MYFKIVNLLIIFLFSITLSVCKGENTGSDSSSETAVDPMTQKGVGPVTSVTLGEIDSAKALNGKKSFDMKCMACHEFDTKKVGPALKDVTKRRTPEWIMNMILNPNEMTQKDPIAMDLLATFLTQMANQNLKEEEARDILEYFRQKDK